MALLRSLLFVLVFYGGSTVLAVPTTLAALRSQQAIFPWTQRWGRFHRWCCEAILGQHIVVRGHPINEPALYVFKHESMFETLDLLVLFDEPAVVAKQELLRVPLWGFVGKRHGIIFLAREAGAAALRTLIAQARAAAKSGRPIILFAEGTRVAHGERPPLRAGFAAIYKMLDLPVVPVAIDSGRLSPRRSFIKQPGTITYVFGERIPSGLSRAEIETRVHTAINILNI